MNTFGADKQAYYQRVDVVEQYDNWRFGSPGGRYVDALEKQTVLELLKDQSREGCFLDMPCGTGRLLRVLGESGFQNLMGADSSPAMLEKSREAWPAAKLEERNAFATGFEGASFDGICSLRFLFHVQNGPLFLKEVARLLKPGGTFVFDSLRWTPRGLIPTIDRALGGRLYCYGERELATLLAQEGMEMVAKRRILLLPSLAYRYIPGFLVPLLTHLEAHLPTWTFTKLFVVARKR